MTSDTPKATTQDAVEPLPALDRFGGFSPTAFVIRTDSGHCAANSATLPDLTKVDGLACFPTASDAEAYMALPEPRGIAGEVEEIDFNGARDIAKSKQGLKCLLLFVRGRIVEYHYIR